MRVLDGEQQLVRVFVGESDRWHHQPLATALVERLRREGFACATVLRGMAGFGAHSVLHTTQILRLSQDLPVVIDIVETDDRIGRLLPILDEMVTEGLVTIEKVRVERLGTQGFPRMRLGIGRPPGQMDPAAYVLQEFPEGDTVSLSQTLDSAADAVFTWMDAGLEAAMNRFNALGTDSE